MSCCRCQCDAEAIKRVGLEHGACAVGIANAAKVSTEAIYAYDRWIANGYHAGMEYMERYKDVRSNPDLLLPGVQSIIVFAFPYPRPSDIKWANGALRIAAYALGDDYHTVLRSRLQSIAKKCGLGEDEIRICIDTAPLRERYWAVQAGIGFIGLNGQLIVPGTGSNVFIATILTTVKLSADSPCTMSCGSCRRCLACCPAGAIVDDPERKGHTFVDARKCLSYLTIEHRGELPEGLRLGNRLYGCDMCQSACPHNRVTSTVEPLREFGPRPALLNLTKESVENMTTEEYTTLMRNSAIKRTKLEGLKRNAERTN